MEILVFSSGTFLFAANGHLSNLERGSRHGASELQVRSYGFQVHEHVLQVAGDGNLGNRKCQLAIADPQARRAARVVAGYDVDAEAHQLGYIEPIGNARKNLLRALDAFLQVKVPVPDAGITGEAARG